MKIMKMKKIISSVVIATVIASMMVNSAFAGTKVKKTKSVTQTNTVVTTDSGVQLVPEISLSESDINTYLKNGGKLHIERKAAKGITIQYASAAHQKMASRALTILKNDKGTIAYNKMNEAVLDDDGNTVYGGQVSTRLAYQTDDVENDFFSYLGHFYGEGGENYLGLSSPTAYTRFNNHYSKAVTQYNNGNKFTGYKQLGMAIHYLEDINAPHHASNEIAFLSNHTEYETWVDSTISNYLVSSSTITDYNYMCNNSIKAISDKFSAAARETYSSCGSSDFQITSISSTRDNCVRVQKAIAGLYYRFLKDTKRI